MAADNDNTTAAARARVYVNRSNVVDTYQGLVVDLVAAGYLREHMVPPDAHGSGEFRVGRPTKDRKFRAGDLTVRREGPLATVMVWSTLQGSEVMELPDLARSLGPSPEQLRNKVVMLPTAAAVPPVQVRGKGRFPRHIVPLYQGRVIKKRRADAEALIAATRRGIAMFEEKVAQCWADIAELEHLTKR